MKNAKLKVSVVVATYNGAKYLRQQLDSIISQTYPLHEIIIQDDGSTDTTADICCQYATEYANVHFFRNATNLGFNKNFETACMRTSGDLVALSDQDDVWYPNKIEKQVEAIGNHDICFCCHMRGRNCENSSYVTPQYSLEALLFTGFAGHTMLLRGDFVRSKSSWINYIHYDWSLAINAQLGHGIVRIDEPLNWHRTHDDSAIASEQRRFGKEFNKKQTWQPYVYGWQNYHLLQKKRNWQKLYTYIYDHTSLSFHPLAHKMSGLMLCPGLLSLLRLCYICLKHRDSIYWNGNAKGVMGKVRSFAYPLIFTVNNVQYDL